MPKDLTHRSFTVRVPLDMYVEMSELAQKDSQHLNQKVNELLKLGLDREADLTARIVRFVRLNLPEEKDND